jgi:hypothetical protein
VGVAGEGRAGNGVDVGGRAVVCDVGEGGSLGEDSVDLGEAYPVRAVWARGRFLLYYLLALLLYVVFSNVDWGISYTPLVNVREGESGK